MYKLNPFEIRPWGEGELRRKHIQALQYGFRGMYKSHTDLFLERFLQVRDNWFRMQRVHPAVLVTAISSDHKALELNREVANISLTWEREAEDDFCKAYPYQCCLCSMEIANVGPEDPALTWQRETFALECIHSWTSNVSKLGVGVRQLGVFGGRSHPEKSTWKCPKCNAQMLWIGKCPETKHHPLFCFCLLATSHPSDFFSSSMPQQRLQSFLHLL